MPAQARLEFDPDPTLPDSGFEIGWDHARRGLVPPVEHLASKNPIYEGWVAGRAAFGRRTLRDTRHARNWLRLRTNAWLRGRAFDCVHVTPNYLAQIDSTHCPITREALTHATGGPNDASVDRVNNDAGYAAGNLALISARANAAKAAHGWRGALASARRIEAEALASIDGLDAVQWSRLAVLISFATPLGHAEAACLPLVVLPPNRLRVLNAVQALQVLLTLQFTRPGYSKRIAELSGLFAPGEVRQCFHLFAHTLLARRVAAGRLDEPSRLRQAMEDIWCDPLVNRRWQRLSLRLDGHTCEDIVRRAALRCLAGTQCRWLARGAATEGWALEAQGYAAAPHFRSRRTSATEPAPRWPAIPAANHTKEDVSCTTQRCVMAT